jgi:hypothetical protein
LPQGKGYNVKAVTCDFRTDCLGYSTAPQEQQLRDACKGLPGRKIGKLRKEGVQVTEEYKERVLLFLGDTTEVVFERYQDSS